jgi:hypothetical protein
LARGSAIDTNRGIAGEIEGIDLLGLQLVDERGVIRFAGFDRFEQDSGDTVIAQPP